ncbi:MAG: phosphoribosylamine--glycine ligase, partial [Candidatus Micrarchaeota archaeon]
MRVLLIGNGAREHTIASAACRSGAELYAYMGARNPGIARLCRDFSIGAITNAPEILEYARKHNIDLVVVGPEAVLEAGVTDALIKAGISCASPTREASRLEWDKAYARGLLKKHKIRGCPRFGVFSDAAEAAEYID